MAYYVNVLTRYRTGILHEENCPCARWLRLPHPPANWRGPFDTPKEAEVAARAEGVKGPYLCHFCEMRLARGAGRKIG